MNTAKYFEPEIYKPHPEKPGYLLFDRMRTLGDLMEYCKEALEPSGVLDQLEYFSPMWRKKDDDPLPERIKWLVVFVVTGGSEGHYIHIEAITTNDDPRRGHDRELLILGKSLAGKMDDGLKIVNILAPLLS